MVQSELEKAAHEQTSANLNEGYTEDSKEMSSPQTPESHLTTEPSQMF